MSDILREFIAADGYTTTIGPFWGERQWLMDKLIRFALWIGSVRIWYAPQEGAVGG